jgi:undecaprenyl diphosphate synthase
MREGTISPLPKHVAIIMDGNGRWARGRGLSRFAGHRAGADNIHRVVEWLHEYGIRYLTLWAFSTDNWIRPRREVLGLLRLLNEVIDREVTSCLENGIRLLVLGQIDELSQRLQSKIKRAIRLTRNGSRMVLSIAFNYSGRNEILDAVRKIIRDSIPAERVDEALFNDYLYTAGLPEPDLVIRTGGERRLSNFLTWQAAYSEYYFTPTLWPDFDEAEIEKALLDYSQRERRFGGLRASGGKGTGSGP